MGSPHWANKAVIFGWLRGRRLSPMGLGIDQPASASAPGPILGEPLGIGQGEVSPDHRSASLWLDVPHRPPLSGLRWSD